MLDRIVTRPLDRERDWHFFREKHPLTDAVRSQIRELSVASAQLVWNELVQRNQYRHPNQLPRGHWVGNHRATGPLWTPIWNNPAQPDPVVAFLRRELPWPEELPVLFIEMRECIPSPLGVCFWMRGRIFCIPTRIHCWCLGCGKSSSHLGVAVMYMLATESKQPLKGVAFKLAGALCGTTTLAAIGQRHHTVPLASVAWWWRSRCLVEVAAAIAYDLEYARAC